MAFTYFFFYSNQFVNTNPTGAKWIVNQKKTFKNEVFSEKIQK